jgi:hypothetical protein
MVRTNFICIFKLPLQNSSLKTTYLKRAKPPKTNLLLFRLVGTVPAGYWDHG